MATKTSELREMHDEALEHLLADAKQTLFNLRFQNATGELDNVARFGEVRREIAAHEALVKEQAHG